MHVNFSLMATVAADFMFPSKLKTFQVQFG